MNEILLMMGPLFPSTQESIEKTYSVHHYWQAEDKAELLNQIADQCVGVVTDGGLGISTEVLQQLPNVGMISIFGVGTDAVDLGYCRQKGIKVGNTPDVLSDDVADMAVALALAVSRQLVTGDRYARAGLWEKNGAMPLTTRMMGKRAGIYGLGSIGSCLAKRLNGFDMDISYCNRRQRTESSLHYVQSLQQLAADVDFLFVTASATDDSVGSINETVLKALGRDGYLINVSRGSLVDETALIHSLINNTIAGAGLDVFSAEPHIPEELLRLDNLVLQPHNASGTWETRLAMGQLVIDNLSAHFAGNTLPASVTA